MSKANSKVESLLSTALLASKHQVVSINFSKATFTLDTFKNRRVKNWKGRYVNVRRWGHMVFAFRDLIVLYQAFVKSTAKEALKAGLSADRHSLETSAASDAVEAFVKKQQQAVITKAELKFHASQAAKKVRNAQIAMNKRVAAAKKRARVEAAKKRAKDAAVKASKKGAKDPAVAPSKTPYL